MKLLLKIVPIIILSCILFSCSETSQILLTSSDGISNMPLNSPATAQLVVEVRLAPSFLKFRNGDEVRVQVSTYAAGGVEVLAPFSPSIEGEQVVQILPATPSSTSNREIILKGKGVGETVLVVRSGDARGQASITVTSAN